MDLSVFSNRFFQETPKSVIPVSTPAQTYNGAETQESSVQRYLNNFGSSLSEKTHFFTGTAEKVIAWNRVSKQRWYYEVIASLISVQESRENLQNILLLKDKKGPILQVIHYFNHEIVENEFNIGQMIRCVGYMSGINTMIAINIRKATGEEIASLKRHCYLGDFTISGLLNAEENRQ